MPDPATENRQLIERFYDAFDRCDGETMAGCYLPDATFRDPVFGTLTGEHVGNMWRMLTAKAKELKIDSSNTTRTRCPVQHRGRPTTSSLPPADP